jgi:ribosomal protein S18 acetylase RimI-like enzyme
LFFERNSVDGTTVNNNNPQRKIAEQTFEGLRSPNVTFPFLVQYDEKFPQKFGSSDEKASSTHQEQFSIRFMTPDDLPDLVPLCLAEFGDAVPQTFSWRQLSAWWEQFCFETIVTWTLRLKMRANQEHQRHDIVSDPAMLVLTRKTSPPHMTEQVIGMVELSLQPPDLNRNPPALPLPLWIKQSLAERTPIGSLQGWITNVLIDPDFRGKKLAKVLMAATEGIARRWGCSYIFLHADADIRSGRIPQKLYESLGYKMVPSGRKEDFSWTGEALDLFSSVRMVDGVALICYSKELL